MRAFAGLLDGLTFTPARNGKLRLLERYFAAAPDPDRGYALAVLTGELDLRTVKPALIRDLATQRIDAELFAMSYDYVGDLAETVSLIWHRPRDAASRDVTASLGETVAALNGAGRTDAAKVVASLLDSLDAPARYALLKLITGGLRVGVSARLARQALARFGGRDVAEIEELWHGLSPPYEALFAWLEGRSDRPEAAGVARFRPVMLSHPTDLEALAALNPADFAAEWKWDGIRVQMTGLPEPRLFSRTGDDIGAAFPDLVGAADFAGVIDGELLVGVPGAHVGSFGDLQQRLNRKTVSRKLLASHPAFLRAYDLLFDGEDDVRGQPFAERRQRLEALAARLDSARFDLSPLVAFDDWHQLDAMRAAPPHREIEGVMIKRLDSPYLAGRPKGHWFKWKRDPFTIDAVLLYAQRGHGKRSSFFSDFTFGVWDETSGTRALVPVGKAYFGFTDAELAELDRYVRNNTVDRFGPVRAVRADAEAGLVLEVAFEGLNRSTRHKSGVAMRFPRISRIRWDKPSAEADTLDMLKATAGLAPPEAG